MSPVAVAADRRFRRIQIRPSRARRGWRVRTRNGVAVALALSCLAYGTHRAAAFAAHARVLRVDHIVVTGNERLSNSDVLAVLSGLRGENLVRVNLAAWRDRLLSSPWIEDAALRRVLPSTVEVVVTERRPIGIGRAAGQMYLIDRGGGVIDDYGPQYADLDLPVIDGLTVADGSEAADQPKAALAARVIASLASRPEIARRLSQIDVHDVHNAAVILSGDPAVIELGDRAFLSRLQSYLELAPALRERVPDIDYVDLRFEGRVYVRPLEKGARPATAAGLLRR